jgi:hypothetical protein
MIIGEALKRLFAGAEYEYTNTKGDTSTRSIQFHYGDHKELVKWTKLKTQNNRPKYPLVWYVINPYLEDNTGNKIVTSKLIILHTFSNRQDNLNDVISGLTYDSVIEPVWNVVKGLLVDGRIIELKLRIKTNCI